MATAITFAELPFIAYSEPPWKFHGGDVGLFWIFGEIFSTILPTDDVQ